MSTPTPITGPSPASASRRGWPGPLSTALFEEEQGLIAPGLQQIALLSRLSLREGRGSWVTDLDGHRYLDFNAGVSVASLGHAHPRLTAALREQAEQLSVGSFTSEPRVRLLQRIAEWTPGNLRRTQLFSSGAEAVEAAIRLARSVTGRTDIIGFTGGFHGKTGGVLPLSDVPWKAAVGPLAPGTHLSPFPDPAAFPGPAEDCRDQALRHLRELVQSQAKDRLAAILVEPIQGTAGNVIPPPGFLNALRDLAHENGALLIADEIITGFGRTGRRFGVDHDGVVPDILTIGKGMGGGFPISGVVTTDAHAQALPWSLPSASSSSYGGSPLAAAAAEAVLRVIAEERLTEHSARVGAVLLEGLRGLQAKYPFVGDVRGRGLLLGLDLTCAGAARRPLPQPLCERFFFECLRRGLILMSYVPRVRIHPPLILTEAEAREGIDRLDGALSALAPEVPRP